ncbi:MAG: GNAT family N-acetyltransferase [Nevskia sp.]|nr:GNAT family N-acetyltransferase [Nevskia sp.]
MERLIRPMTVADVAACLTLWRQTEGLVVRLDSDNEIAVTRFLKRNPGLNFVVKSDGELVGNALCGCDGRRGYLYHLAVARGFRREGCASAMLSAVFAALRKQGITRCHAFVLSSNLTAQKFWAGVNANQRQDMRVITVNVEEAALTAGTE